MSATWGNPENIYSLRVLPPVTRSRPRSGAIGEIVSFTGISTGETVRYGRRVGPDLSAGADLVSIPPLIRRHWIITADITRKLAEGEVEWARSKDASMSASRWWRSRRRVSNRANPVTDAPLRNGFALRV